MAVRNPNGADYGRSFTIDTGRGTLNVQDPDTNALFLYKNNGRDVSFLDVAFNNTTILTNPWTITADGTATTWAQDATVPGGAILGVTGTTAEGALSLFGPPIWQPQLNCGMEVSLKVDEPTEIRLEVGFVNVVTDKTLPVCTDVDTPTFAANSTEVAIMSWQTDDTITTPRFVTDSLVHTTAKGVTLMTPYGAPAADQSAWSPTADEWFTIRVQCYGPPPGSAEADATGSVSCAVFDDKNNIVAYTMFDAIEGVLAGGVGPTAMLAPWVFCGTIDTTDKNIHVRYARVWADRYLN